MSLLAILSSTEHTCFDSPPVFTSQERIIQFKITNTELKFIQNLKTSTNQVGFLLQLGYFKASGKIFTAENFKHNDIIYVSNLLGVKVSDLKFVPYQKKTGITHRKTILSLLSWQPFTTHHLKILAQYIERLIQKQLPHKQVFSDPVHYCWEHKIEIPSAHTLTNLLLMPITSLKENY